MKKLILITLIVLLLPSSSFAQEDPEPSQNQISSDSADLEKIQQIKEKVANRVSELNLVEKRGIIGKVKETSSTQVTITDYFGKTRIIEIDELTDFGEEDDEELGVGDLETGSDYSFVGLYNKDTERLLARVVDGVDSLPVFIHGVITEINEEDFQVVVTDESGSKKTIDIERSTSTNLVDAEKELSKSGFSQLEIGQRAIVAGFFDPDDESVIAASRLIHFEDIPPSGKMQQYVTNASESADLDEEEIEEEE